MTPLTPKQVLAGARSKLVADAARSSTKARSRGSQRTRDGRRLVMTTEPELIVSEAGATVGVEVHVRLYGRDGTEVPIDPVRRVINPPTEIATPDGEPNEVDPVGAFWSVLWDSIDTAPHPEGWVP